MAYEEIGRVALVNYGKDYGKLSVFVNVIDQNQATIRIPEMEMNKENIRKNIKVVVVRRILAGKAKNGKIKHWKFTGEGRSESRNKRDQAVKAAQYIPIYTVDLNCKDRFEALRSKDYVL
ncbi:60S ribosomal protein L14-1-like [Hevea brasiliensis]|uniref:60S ribosomal protein L14-1-like n=1 Tax=Hevea brasiliensis TaxID=3981 RepID=UPI0025DA77D4|nr:60S ribosomal protein L14-1-like [Hevea brasiliensis]